MLNMNYIGDSIIYPVEFNTISDNVIELKGEFPILTDGFLLSRPEHKDNWDYSTYTTVYRKVDGGVQFSNDDSIYAEPEPIPDLPNVPFEYNPTPEEFAEQEQKRKEAEAVPTNAELSMAVLELAENISDIENAIAEIGQLL